MHIGWGLFPFRSDTSDHFPIDPATQPAYDSTQTVVKIPIRLEAGRSYAVVLGRGFRTTDGTPLARTVIRFQTR
jgi:hypothetical protein